MSVAPPSNSLSTPLSDFVAIDFENKALVPQQEVLQLEPEISETECFRSKICNRDVRLEWVPCGISPTSERVLVAALMLFSACMITCCGCHFCSQDSCCFLWSNITATSMNSSAPFCHSPSRQKRSWALMILGITIVWAAVFTGKALESNPAVAIPVMVCGEIIGGLMILSAGAHCLSRRRPLEMTTMR